MAIIVGMMIASMIAVELMRIVFSALTDRPDRIEDAAVAGGERERQRRGEAGRTGRLTSVLHRTALIMDRPGSERRGQFQCSA